MVVRAQASSSTPAAQTTDQVFTASTGTVAQTVSAQGTVAAAQTDDLSFGSSGTVTAVNVTAGQQVKTGDVLAEIDSAALAGRGQRRGIVSSPKPRPSSPTTRPPARPARRSSADKSSVATADDKVDAAQKALDGAKLVATFDGTVVAGQRHGR